MQRYFSYEKQDNSFILSNDDIYHIKTVMRMQDGDSIEVVYQGSLFECCLVNVKNNIQIIIQKEIKIRKNNHPKVTLIIPVLRENKMNLILQKATEMGADKIIIVSLNRCVTKVNQDKKHYKLDRWRRIVKEASEQSKQLTIPQIEFKDSIKYLDNLEGLNLICSTIEREKNFKRVLTKNRNCDRINLVIGPEGGLTPEEESYLESIGYTKITLGNQILRVETVPLFLMSAIVYEYME